MKLLTLIRARWFRLGVPFAVGVSAGVLSIAGGSQTAVRTALLASLQGNIFIFGIASAIALFLLGNFVRGLRSSAYGHVAALRRNLWETFDALSNSSDPAIQDLREHHLAPLLRLSRQEWLEPSSYERWSNIGDAATRISDQETRDRVLKRYLLPIEEELNDLAVCTIRGWCVDVLVTVSRNLFALLIAAALVNVLGRLAPVGTLVNGMISTLCAVVVAALVVEVTHAFTWVLQEIREEYSEILEAPAVLAQEEARSELSQAAEEEA